MKNVLGITIAFSVLSFAACSSSGGSSGGLSSSSGSSGGSSGSSGASSSGASSSGASSSGASSSGASSSGASSSGSGSSSGGTVAIDPSCADLAKAYCTKYLQCDTYRAAEYYGNDEATCEKVFGETCSLRLAAQGTSATAQSNEACAQAVSQITGCGAWYDTTIAACADKPGTLADGATCSDDAQCKGGACNYSAAGNCGACGAKAPAPACTYDTDCTNGQVCNYSGACVTPGDVGATCDFDNALCKHSLNCKVTSVSDAGVPSGTCAALVAAGQTCDPNSDACVNGYGCGSGNTCVAVTLVAAGGACDFQTQLCKSSYCVYASQTATTGTCTALIPIGGACDPQNPPPCDQEGSCIAGKCQLPAQCH